MVTGPRPFDFPTDHGPHPEYRSEWWYFTGNVKAADGSRYGFQLTFFRFRLAANSSERRSRWAAEQVYMAHFAVTDVEARRFHAFERFSRGALDLAGARALTFPGLARRLECERGGRCRRLRGAPAGERGGNGHRPRVRAGRRADTPRRRRIQSQERRAGQRVALLLLPAHAGVRPTLDSRGEPFEVTGEGWLDREWSSSALASDQAGWDWFALRLSDDSELMLYQLRRRDGSADPFSYGLFLDAAGDALILGPHDFMIEARKYWQSSDKKVTYPSGWRLRISLRGSRRGGPALGRGPGVAAGFSLLGGSGLGAGPRRIAPGVRLRLRRAHRVR